MIKKIFVLFIYVFLVFGIFGTSFPQVIKENYGRCNLKFNLPKEENNEYNLKLHYIIKYLSYKIKKMPDIIIRQGEEPHMEFDMDKSCQEILQIIIEKL